ncbi:MAG: aerotolerance regulator BatA [Flavobacteriaceae bacterium]|nr:aerotolerance regulator BatA [Flavobacteriaceae bacterium]|tara:strand:- start:15224 stop:16222 length:999 start_codon:yes stop_codon:yes gene_type:complete
MDNIVFKNPEFLWLLILLPVISYMLYKFKFVRLNNFKFSNLESFDSKTLKSKLYPLINIFRIITLLLVIVALARPQKISNSTRTKTSSGIDIVIAVDISSSMLAQDLKPNRLEALKKVASQFINDRINDRIGLVIYAGESYTKTPVTSDKDVVIKSLSDITFDGIIEDGTAIGMGLATSVNRLKESKAKSKVIILLTDGVNNSGFIDPSTAADLAANFEIKTYTIGLGTNGNARAPVALNPNGSFRFGMTKVEIDEELLKNVASKTGGLYFRATDNKKLEEIYNEINKLEKTEVEEIKYSDSEEKYRLLVIAAIGLIFVELILKYTVFKSII